MRSIEDIASEYLGRGGKMLRPKMARAVYDAAGGGAGDFGSVATAVECFHKASLIHDDIQDGDVERYGRPSLHTEVGIPIAIAVGDWLVAHGYDLIASSGFDRTDEMVKATASSHVRLCEGQGDELLLVGKIAKCGCNVSLVPEFNEKFVLSIYERKTGEAFALAAELGALAATKGGASLAASARRMGLAYGTAFQIRDDLGDGGHLLLDACGGDVGRLKRIIQDNLKVLENENETTVHCDLGPFGVW